MLNANELLDKSTFEGVR